MDINKMRMTVRNFTPADKWFYIEQLTNLIFLICHHANYVEINLQLIVQSYSLFYHVKTVDSLPEKSKRRGIKQK